MREHDQMKGMVKATMAASKEQIRTHRLAMSQKLTQSYRHRAELETELRKAKSADRGSGF